MEYEGRICRGPMERASYMLPVAVGCSYNACRFCMLFKHLQYRELPLEQIEAELQRVHALNAAPKVVYLGDGNAMHLPHERMMTILQMIEKYLPNKPEIRMDSTVTDILERTDEQLQALYDHGVRRLYLGIESGLEDILRTMCKDHTIPQAKEAIGRIHRIGMCYGAHIMTGIAGKGRCIENAEALAAFLNACPPVAIVNFSLFAHRRAPMWSDVEKGTFVVADEVETMREERRLLELLDLPGCDYDGMHDFIEFRVRGRLPEQKDKMLCKMDEGIAEWEKEPEIYCIVP